VSEPQPLNERVAALLNELITDAGGAGAAHLAERLRSEASRWRSTETTVVVAAEPNRGKSALVNALLGEDLLPTGANEVTTTYVVLRHGNAPRAIVHRHDSKPLVTTVAGAARWITAPVAEEVGGVVIEVDHPLLATGLTLVDTPGVGGVDSAHGRLTMAALATADALVFALDATEPVSAPEVAFLAKATERLDRVIFALTKVDHAPGWRTIADDDRRLIEQHAPRFASAPIVPVSARLKVAADRAKRDGSPDPSLAEESGVPALSDALMRSVVGQVARVRLANLLRLADTVLDELEAPVAARSHAGQGESEAKAQAAADQAALDELRDVAERLQIDVTDRFNGLRDQANLDLTRSLKEIGARFDAEAPGAPTTTEAIADGLQIELRATCAELSNTIGAEIDALVADVGAAVGDLDVELPSVDLGGDEPLELSGTDTDSAGKSSMVKMRVASAAASGGTGLTLFARSLGTDPVLAAVMGAGALLAVATAAINVRLMRKQTDVASARKQVQTALDTARNQITPALRQQILSAQRELERAMRIGVRRRIKELSDQVASSTQLARADDAARQKAQAEADARLAALTAKRTRVTVLRDELQQSL
jgi:hypothetical protein